jgi:hypothetical protein
LALSYFNALPAALGDPPPYYIAINGLIACRTISYAIGFMALAGYRLKKGPISSANLHIE